MLPLLALLAGSRVTSDTNRELSISGDKFNIERIIGVHLPPPCRITGSNFGRYELSNFGRYAAGELAEGLMAASSLF